MSSPFPSDIRQKHSPTPYSPSFNLQCILSDGPPTEKMACQNIDAIPVLPRKRGSLRDHNPRLDRGSVAANVIALNYALEVAATFTWLSAIEVSFLLASPSSSKVCCKISAVWFSPSRRAKLRAVP
jgi:hypothetical protein